MGVRQGGVPIPWGVGVVDHTGAAEEAGVHLGVGVGVGVDVDVRIVGAGRREEGHLVLLEGDSQGRGHGRIALQQSAAWLEG